MDTGVMLTVGHTMVLRRGMLRDLTAGRGIMGPSIVHRVDGCPVTTIAGEGGFQDTRAITSAAGIVLRIIADNGAPSSKKRALKSTGNGTWTAVKLVNMMPEELTSDYPQRSGTAVLSSLVEAAKGGDREAFDEIVELLQDRIFRMIYYRTGSRMKDSIL